MRNWTWLVAGLVVGPGGLIGPRPAAAQPSPTLVALSGTAAPAGGTFSGFGDPVLNGSGQVAFRAFLNGGSSNGVFVGDSGAIQVVALQGTAAPAGGNYDFFSIPRLNGSGQVAFFAGLTGGSSTQGIFRGAPEAVQAAALTNTAAPAGGTYSDFNVNGLPVLNGSGQVAFSPFLTGGSSSGGVFVGAPGAVQAAALQGTAAPAGGNYLGFGSTAVNGSGQVAFFALLNGGSSTEGIFVGAPGAVQAVALRGNAAPAGGNYGSLAGNPGVNGSGQVAFFANLTGGSSTSGYFMGAPGAVQAIALQNTSAPAGGTYSTFSNRSPVLNGSGQVVFRADLTGGSSTQGIFVGVPGAVQAAALQGTAAPAGGTYSAFSDAYLVVNGPRQVAFRADLTGAGADDATNLAKFSAALLLRHNALTDALSAYKVQQDAELSKSHQLLAALLAKAGGSAEVSFDLMDASEELVVKAVPDEGRRVVALTVTEMALA